MIDLKVRLHSGSLAETLWTFRPAEMLSGNGPLRRSLRWVAGVLVAGVIVVPAIYEIRTSALQSWLLSRYAQKLSYKVHPGRSSNIVFPQHGPFDIRAGYALIPDFQRRLEAAGYRVTSQARFSPELERAARWGILPPFREPASTRLTIQGEDGARIFQTAVADLHFESFETIPSLLVKSVVLIEDRDLEQAVDDRSNPVVDWDRLAKAVLLYAAHKLGLPVSVEGGSTLATQMEKYRHSHEGRTNSIAAKLRQMTDATLKVYHNGPDTRDERRQIILDYLNSVPLAAAPKYGEIHGIGDGLYTFFGLKLHDFQKALLSADTDPAKAKALKQALALLCSVKAPTYYLLKNHSALEARVRFYSQMLARAQVISPELAKLVIDQPLSFHTPEPSSYASSYVRSKAVNDVRNRLLRLLGIPSLYELDRLDVNVESTINANLQRKVEGLFHNLRNPEFVEANGFRQERLLANGDPSKVVYGMMLFEKTPEGNLLRIVTDNLDAPFDINTGMKMQLGSTAKLRTLANYLYVVSSLYEKYSRMDRRALDQETKAARDPITTWTIRTLNQSIGMGIDALLQLALERKYSASPKESFFTGGGVHAFHNFDSKDDGRILTVREATERSVNLVYLRLMRDLVRYYEARLPYDSNAVLSDIDNPLRHKLLQRIADEESKYFLFRAYRELQGRPAVEIIESLLGNRAKSDRNLTVLFYAWNRGGDDRALTRWLETYLGTVTPQQVRRMVKAYGNPGLDLSDYGYLLGIHPLQLWCGGELIRDPSLEWNQLWSRSGVPRQIASAWLFKTRNRPAQDLRLKIRFEQDAFTRMTAFWQRLGFPFDRLVPSLATAIGSSGDRPEALARLMGIFLNGGVLRPSVRVTRVQFGGGTPYETTMRFAEPEGKRVLPEAVARAILPVLAEVVNSGTAARVAGAYKVDGKPLVLGGKTGSGDNRFDAVGRRGRVISSRPVDRTAVFVFYIGDRFYGTIVAYVQGEESDNYSFTSSLPVAILKFLAPAIGDLFSSDSRPPVPVQKSLTIASKPDQTLRAAERVSSRSPTGGRLVLAAENSQPTDSAALASRVPDPSDNGSINSTSQASATLPEDFLPVPVPNTTQTVMKEAGLRSPAEKAAAIEPKKPGGKRKS